jgi:hypothetical protein
MAGQRLEDLNRRKQALVVESDLNRLALRLEYEQLRAATAGLDGALATARRLGPWLLPAASVAGVLAVVLLRRGSGMVDKATSLLRWVSPALALWRQFGGRRRAGTES